MDEKPYAMANEPGTPKSDAQIVGILKNGGSGTPTTSFADTVVLHVDGGDADALNGRLEKLAAGPAEWTGNGQAQRRKSLTPSITAVVVENGGGNNHVDSDDEIDDDDDDDDYDGVEDVNEMAEIDSVREVDGHSAEDPVSKTFAIDISSSFRVWVISNSNI